MQGLALRHVLSPLSLLVVAAGPAAASAPTASACAAPFGAHTWDITEVFSNADGTVQFIELQECCGGTNELGLPGRTLSSNLRTWTIPGPSLVPPSSNKHFLIATQGFADLPGAPTPDRILPSGLVPFFDATGDTVSYVPYDSWTFGTVPTNGTDSLLRDGSTGPNTPTNYAGDTGTVDANPLTTSFCFGIGCPCSNDAADTGCLTSSGVGSLLSGVGGSTSLAADDLRLDATCPPGNSGLMLVNAMGDAPLPLFDGLNCVRGGPRVAPGADNGMPQPFGDVDLVADDGVRNFGDDTGAGTGFYGIVELTFPGFIGVGNSYVAQYWFRDVLCGPPPAPCPTPCLMNANFSNGAAFTVSP